MPELTTPESPVRVFVSERRGRMVINRPDCLLIVCLICAGTKAIILHKNVGKADIPTVFACSCDARYISQEGAHAAIE